MTVKGGGFGRGWRFSPCEVRGFLSNEAPPLPGLALVLEAQPAKRRGWPALEGRAPASDLPSLAVSTPTSSAWTSSRPGRRCCSPD